MNGQPSVVVEFDERQTVEPISRDAFVEELRQKLGENEFKRVQENSTGYGW